MIYVSSKAEDEKGAFIREVLPRVIATLDLENNGKVCASTMTKFEGEFALKNAPLFARVQIKIQSRCP